MANPGLSSVEAGLRLRYEVRKELAPYVGVEWSRAFRGTADYIAAAGGEAETTRFIIGLKARFQPAGQRMAQASSKVGRGLRGCRFSSVP